MALLLPNLTSTNYIIEGITSRIALFEGSSSSLQLFAGSSAGFNSVANVVANTPYVVTAFVNGASSYLHVNGADSDAQNPGSNALQGLRIARFSTGYGEERIYQLLGWNRALTGTEISNLDTWLKAKNGASF